MRRSIIAGLAALGLVAGCNYGRTPDGNRQSKQAQTQGEGTGGSGNATDQGGSSGFESGKNQSTLGQGLMQHPHPQGGTREAQGANQGENQGPSRTGGSGANP